MDGLFHTILSGANVGILALAAAAFALRFFLKDSQSPLARGADTVAYVSAAFGVALAVFTALTGYFGTWHIAAVSSSMLLVNKVILSFMLLGAWGAFVFLRWKTGPAMWENMILKIWAGVLVVLGFISSGLLGSLGGSAALKGTAIQGVFAAFNINRYNPWTFATWFSIVLIMLALGLAFYSSQQKAK
jgi:hypothetical protein